MEVSHESAHSLFLFASMPAADRRLILEMGEFLTQTRGRYRREIESTLRMIRTAAETESPCACDQSGSLGSSRVLPFRRPIH